MDLALKAAENAGKSGEVPIGCVIVRDNDVIAAAGNRTLTDRDPTAHAEMLAIRLATEMVGSERLVDCDLYVTLEPCTMCAAAISFARVRRLYYGAADPKGGAVESGVRFFASPTCHHVPRFIPRSARANPRRCCGNSSRRGGSVDLILRSPPLRASRRMGRPPPSFETPRFAMLLRMRGYTSQPAKNSFSAFAVASGFSSVRK